MMPLSFKLVAGIFVDLKVVSKRKYILGFMALVQMFASVMVAASESADEIIYPQTLMTASIIFLDATIDSIIV